MSRRSEAPTHRTVGLDYVVTSANADAPLAARARVAGASASVGCATAAAPGRRTKPAARTPAVRLKFLLHVVDRHPERKADIARCLRATIAESNALMLLCETGLPRANAFLQEFGRARRGKAAAGAARRRRPRRAVPPRVPRRSRRRLGRRAAGRDARSPGARCCARARRGRTIDPLGRTAARRRRRAAGARRAGARRSACPAASGGAPPPGRPLDSPFADLVDSVREFIVALRGSRGVRRRAGGAARVPARAAAARSPT